MNGAPGKHSIENSSVGGPPTEEFHQEVCRETQKKDLSLRKNLYQVCTAYKEDFGFLNRNPDSKLTDANTARKHSMQEERAGSV